MKSKGIILIGLGVKYNQLAYNLTKSIKKHNPELQVAVITDTEYPEIIEAFDIVQTGDKMSFYRVGDDAWILADNVNVLPSLDGGAGDDDEIIEGKVEDTATPSTIHGDETKQHSSSGGGVANHENGSDTKKSSITTRCSGIMGRLTSKLKFNFKIPCLAMIKAQLSKLLATILYFKGQIWTKIKT